MKRLIETRKRLNFKNWIKQHDPKKEWNWNDPQILSEQFLDTVKVSGDIDLKTIFDLMFTMNDSGLTVEQNQPFLNGKY